MRNHCCINQLPFHLECATTVRGDTFPNFQTIGCTIWAGIARSLARSRPGPLMPLRAFCIKAAAAARSSVPQRARSTSVAWIHIAKWYWTSKKQKKTKCHRQIHTTELSLVLHAGEMRYAESKIIFKASYTSPLVQVKKSLYGWLKSYGKKEERKKFILRKENLLTCCRALCCNNQRRQSHLMVPPPLYARRFYNNIPLLCDR